MCNMFICISIVISVWNIMLETAFYDDIVLYLLLTIFNCGVVTFFSFQPPMQMQLFEYAFSEIRTWVGIQNILFQN